MERKRPRPVPKPGYFMLSSNDLAQTKKFYSKLFGWKFDQVRDNYATFTTGKGKPQGFFKQTKHVKAAPTQVYVGVDSVSKIQKKAKSLGGKVHTKKKTVSHRGIREFGSIEDPQGNVIVLYSKR
jgi:uncharacterized protein